MIKLSVLGGGTLKVVRTGVIVEDLCLKVKSGEQVVV